MSPRLTRSKGAAHEFDVLLRHGLLRQPGSFEGGVSISVNLAAHDSALRIVISCASRSSTGTPLPSPVAVTRTKTRIRSSSTSKKRSACSRAEPPHGPL